MGGALSGRHGECHQQRDAEVYRFIAFAQPHNDAMTYLLGAMSTSSDLHDARNDDIVCKYLLLFSPSLFHFTVTCVFLFIPLSFNCFPAACKTLRDRTQELQVQTTRSCIAGGRCEEFSSESIENKEGKTY